MQQLRPPRLAKKLRLPVVSGASAIDPSSPDYQQARDDAKAKLVARLRASAF